MTHKKYEQAVHALYANNIQSEFTNETLSSIHHILSEITLSLAEELSDGADKFEVREIYLKLNALESLLLYIISDQKKDLSVDAHNIDFLLDEILGRDREF